MMSQRYSRSSWRVLSALLVVVIAFSILPQAPKATAQGGGVSQGITPSNTATSTAATDAPQLVEQVQETSAVTTVTLTHHQVSGSCHLWVWDPTESVGTWDLVGWSPLTGERGLADWSRDGALTSFRIQEEPEWGSPTQLTFSGEFFNLEAGQAGARIEFEPTYNGSSYNFRWYADSQNMGVPQYFQVEAYPRQDLYTSNGMIIRTAGGRQIGWDYVRYFKCYDGIPVATPTPTRTSTPSPTPTRPPSPTPTLTPTPCPTMPPWPTPTATATPDPGAVGTVIFGDSCRHQNSLPIISFGASDYCPMRAPASPNEVQAASALMQIPACFPLDPAVAAAMRQACGGSFSVEWQVSDGREIVGKKLACTGHRPQDAGSIFFKTLVGLSAAEIAALVAAATASGAVVVGAILVGGVIYLVVTYDGPFLEDWVFAGPQTLMDEWALGWMEVGAGMWPGAPLGVRRVEASNQGPALVSKFYDGEWGGTLRTMYAVEPASLVAGQRAAALVQVGMLDQVWSTVLVTTPMAGNRVIAGPISLRYPEEAVNQLANVWEDNYFASKKSHGHAEAPGILAAITEQGMSGPQVRTKGDGNSSGSVQLWASPPVNGLVRVGGYATYGDRVGVFAFEVPVRVGPAAEYIKLFTHAGIDYFYLPRNVVFKHAWYLSKTIGNGLQPEWSIYSRVDGLIRWAEIKGRYGLVILVAILRLPGG